MGTAPGRLVLVLAALLAAAVAAPRPLGADTVLVAASAVWKYLDNGSNQGTAWRGPGFDDSGWASGAAQLGYGDGDEATTVSYGPNASNKYVTTYFRHTFSVADRLLSETLEAFGGSFGCGISSRGFRRLERCLCGVGPPV